MKDKDYVFSMLKRAESKKRKALKEEDDKKFYAFNLLIRQLKIILETPKIEGKNRLKKTIKYNESLNK